MEKLMKKRIYLFYFILLAGVCVTFVLTNISYDAEYQLAMAYRFIKGDKMITQMWEPHQTSAFLCALLMKIYIMVTGTTTGIVLYTQIAGLLIRMGIAAWFYKLAKGCTGEKPALMIGVIYLLISPKELLTPEFGNMQIWFATIMFLFFLQYMKKNTVVHLIGAAVSLCLGVFSYPSAIICYFAAAFILWRYSKQWKRDLIIFTGVCAVIGGVFVLYLLISVGPEMMINCLDCALGVEPTHTVSMGHKLLAHILNIGKIVGMLALVYLIGFLTEGCRMLIKKERFCLNRFLVSGWFVLMLFLLINIISVKNRGGYGFPFVILLLVGFWKRNLLSEKEKRMYYMAMSVSLMNLLATLILSDNAFMQAITYMLIWICASVVPVYRWVEQMDGIQLKRACGMCFHVWLLLIIFRCVYIHIPIYGRSQICSLKDDLSIIRSGPAFGIITDEAGAARQRDSVKEWGQFVKPGDTIWIIGEPVDTLGYLYEDVEVGAPTVMSTPTYNEKLLYYWEINPDKYPDVVIVASSFGELSWEVLQNEWLMNWLEDEYCADTVTDGAYWRYYERRR